LAKPGFGEPPHYVYSRVIGISTQWPVPCIPYPVPFWTTPPPVSCLITKELRNIWRWMFEREAVRARCLITNGLRARFVLFSIASPRPGSSKLGLCQTRDIQFSKNKSQRKADWAFASFDTSSMSRAKNEVKEKLTVTLRWCFPEWNA